MKIPLRLARHGSWFNFINFTRRVSNFSKDYMVREDIYEHLRHNIVDMQFKNTLKHRIISNVFCHYPFLFNYSRYLYIKIIENRLLRYF